jgi:patatin-like phospholipase/acyl hydrolase
MQSSRRLLCLSGGGYRGLFTAIVLENIEARLQSGEKRLLRDHFDLVAGTSIAPARGGIAAGIAARRLREVWKRTAQPSFRNALGPLCVR